MSDKVYRGCFKFRYLNSTGKPVETTMVSKPYMRIGDAKRWATGKRKSGFYSSRGSQILDIWIEESGDWIRLDA